MYWPRSVKAFNHFGNYCCDSFGVMLQALYLSGRLLGFLVLRQEDGVAFGVQLVLQSGLSLVRVCQNKKRGQCLTL